MTSIDLCNFDVQVARLRSKHAVLILADFQCLKAECIERRQNPIRPTGRLERGGVQQISAPLRTVTMRSSSLSWWIWIDGNILGRASGVGLTLDAKVCPPGCGPLLHLIRQLLLVSLCACSVPITTHTAPTTADGDPQPYSQASAQRCHGCLSANPRADVFR